MTERRFPASLAPLALTRLVQPEAQKAPKRDGDHGSPCPFLTISAQQKRSTAMKKTAAIVGVAFTAGMLLTTAFAFSLLPLALT